MCICEFAERSGFPHRWHVFHNYFIAENICFQSSSYDELEVSIAAYIKIFY